MCVDYKGLNRASPKDNFPLPYIDLLVDNTAQHSCYSFMEGFFGYNKIRMALEDKEKTTFITTWGTFCYKIMSFGLKNAGATYQRAMVTLFHDMMHKEVEFYMDDMIAKSKTPRQDYKNIGSINKREIELDLDKVNAIWNMSAPKNEMKVRGFLGRVNYIARFISQLTALTARYLSSFRRTRRWSGIKNVKKPLTKSSNTWSHLLSSSRRYPARI
ncbi:hypothetical protein CR513_18114, partial [Mucuna pruriens]